MDIQEGRLPSPPAATKLPRVSCLPPHEGTPHRGEGKPSRRCLGLSGSFFHSLFSSFTPEERIGIMLPTACSFGMHLGRDSL